MEFSDLYLPSAPSVGTVLYKSVIGALFRSEACGYGLDVGVTPCCVCVNMDPSRTDDHELDLSPGLTRWFVHRETPSLLP